MASRRKSVAAAASSPVEDVNAILGLLKTEHPDTYDAIVKSIKKEPLPEDLLTRFRAKVAELREPHKIEMPLQRHPGLVLKGTYFWHGERRELRLDSDTATLEAIPDHDPAEIIQSLLALFNSPRNNWRLRDILEEGPAVRRLHQMVRSFWAWVNKLERDYIFVAIEEMGKR